MLEPLSAVAKSAFGAVDSGCLAESPLLEIVKAEVLSGLHAEHHAVLEEIRELEDRLSGENKTGLLGQRRAVEQNLAVLKRNYGPLFSHILKIESILQAGYEPGLPPDEWYIGYLEELSLREGSSYLLFRMPIPVGVEKKYGEAKTSKLFAEVVVASPFREDFAEIRVPVEKRDPGLFGFIRKDPRKPMTSQGLFSHSFQFGTLRENLQNILGFRIAIWNIERDIRLAIPH